MVKAWKESVVIPTYEVGKAEKNPIFLEKRVYQGSSGVVYPYPVIESISDEKTDKEYQAVWIENEYIKVMILPELGGRVQMAYDKIKQRHFVYYNHVVKPALVGLLGPWISGGIEFNWPQHHRPSTFMPVDCDIKENADGSVTVWVNEQERMFHQKGMAGFTLRPGCAYLEIKGVLYNRTELPQTFLWWANPAVSVNDYYQSVFPPDINAVFDHGKRAVSSFPIATGTYYKMDYSSGVDISNYKNIKVPTSYMAVNSKYNFEGGYENDTRAGMLHVASNHFSPGKKQWTWGNGDFGQAWDRNLTDDDGPYIELMAGVYTENQPDFSWLMPYEEKTFTQYFMPYRELGVVKNASRDIIFNIEPLSEDKVRYQIFATSKQSIRILFADNNGRVIEDRVAEVSPEKIEEAVADIGDSSFEDLRMTISASDAVDTTPLLTWQPEPSDIRPIPSAAEAALLPQEIKSCDQLYLTGMHLEQYRHATYSPVDYYEEALRRDPDDYRCNNALGLWYLRHGRFDKAEGYLRKAVAVIMRRNPNPYDGEPIYNLGLSLKYQNKTDEAYRMFWKSTWNKAWADAGYLAAAQISLAQNRLTDAKDEIERCLVNNYHNHKARALKATLLRLMQCPKEALDVIGQSLEIDGFNYGCLFERYLITRNDDDLEYMCRLMHGAPNNYDELGLDYLQMGRCSEAISVWHEAEKRGAATPMTYYYLAYSGQTDMLAKAAVACSDFCFPNRLEDVVVLGNAIKANASDSRARYYLGCEFYGARQYDQAFECWKSSAEIDASFPTVWRNMALVYYNKKNNAAEALNCMEKAFELDRTDARVFMELMQLYKKLQRPSAERLATIEKYPELVSQRDDLLLEHITLLNEMGQYSRAMVMLDAHVFHPWEGGEGKVSAQYQICRVELAKEAIAAADYAKAVPMLEECLVYPHHLGEGKLHGAQESDFLFLLGCAYEGLGQKEKAYDFWQRATLGPQEPAAALYYNDAKPDKIFYQGMALLKLDRNGEANGRFYKLVNYGKNNLFKPQKMDYFAVSLPDLQIWEESLDTLNRIHCLYLLALGYFGLGDKRNSERYLSELEEASIGHQGAKALRTLNQNIVRI